ncbi:MAG: thioredoxin [Acidobacteria bacterium]|nr:MAG: thioredoxin [Acidobacteriota bacterium]REK11807.1 MAG: thioredoxin [Acidobacteriota bacterium]
MTAPRSKPTSWYRTASLVPRSSGASSRGRRSARSTVALVVGSTLVLASASFAQAGSTLKGFEQVDDYLLEIDGKADKGATIYFQRRVPAYLVLPAASNTPLLLIPRSRQVQSVSLMKVQNGPGGTLDLADDAVFARQGEFEIAGTEILWTAEGKQYRLRERPPLVGLVDSGDLKEYSRSYATGAASYEPADATIAKLRDEKRKVHLRVYFGSWCPFCQRYLPKIVKVDEQVGDAVQIDYYGLPRDINSDEVARQMKVQSVPTAVLFVDGKEKGRFDRDDWENPERGLARLLGG